MEVDEWQLHLHACMLAGRGQSMASTWLVQPAGSIQQALGMLLPSLLPAVRPHSMPAAPPSAAHPLQ